MPNFSASIWSICIVIRVSSLPCTFFILYLMVALLYFTCSYKSNGCYERTCRKHDHGEPDEVIHLVARLWYIGIAIIFIRIFLRIFFILRRIRVFWLYWLIIRICCAAN